MKQRSTGTLLSVREDGDQLRASRKVEQISDYQFYENATTPCIWKVCCFLDYVVFSLTSEGKLASYQCSLFNETFDLVHRLLI